MKFCRRPGPPSSGLTSSAGCWSDTKGQWLLCSDPKEGPGWFIRAISDSNADSWSKEVQTRDTFLKSIGLMDTFFPTRREARVALELALAGTKLS